MDTSDRRTSHTGDFTRADCRRLERALKRARDVKLYRRLQGVLAVVEGQPMHAAARRVQAGRVSLWRWVERYVERRIPEDLLDPPRPGREPLAPQLTGEKLAQIVTSDPQQHGYNTHGWTVPLLRAHLAQQGIHLSEPTLRRRWHAAGFRAEASPLCLESTCRASGREPGGIVRRLSAAFRRREVLLFTDWTLRRWFPPLRLRWAEIGRQAEVPITGSNDRGVRFGALNVNRTGRTLLEHFDFRWPLPQGVSSPHRRVLSASLTACEPSDRPRFVGLADLTGSA